MRRTTPLARLVRPARRLAGGTLLATLLASGAVAQSTSTVTGGFRYRDLDQDLTGHTGTTSLRYVRHATVQIVDTATGVPLDSDETNATGKYSVTATLVDGRHYSLQVLAESASRGFVVRDGTDLDLDGGVFGPIWGAQFALGVAPLSATVKPGTIVVELFDDPTGGDRVGSPWNILDQAIDTMAFVQTLEPLPTPSLGFTVDLHWPNPDGGGSFASFSKQAVVVGNDDALDDAVLLHEVGHIVHRAFGTSQNPGGTHFLCDNGQDERLSWSEGFATFWGSNVLKSRGEPDPGIYVTTTGLEEVGNLSISYRLEDATGATGLPSCSVPPFGHQSEYAVQCALWDLTDEVGDTPSAPTSDDDPFDGSVMPGGVTPMQAVWDVLTTYMHPMPTGGIPGGVVDVTDFWDGWWASGYMPTAFERDAFVDTLSPWLDRRVELTLSQIFPDVYSSLDDAATNAPPGATIEVRTFSTHTTYPADLVVGKRLRIVLAPGSPSSAVLGP